MTCHKYPSLLRVVHTEFAMFILLYGPILITIIGYIILLYKNYPYEHIDTNEVSMFMFFWVVSLCGMPLIIWWYSVIRKTFSEGCIIDAKVKSLNLKSHSTDFIIEYEFIYNTKKYKHYSNLVVNNKTKTLANQKILRVVFSPKRKVSFLIDAY